MSLVPTISPRQHKRLQRFQSRFEKRYGEGYEGHWLFLLHAAFPIYVTADLLYQLWFNFRLYSPRERTEAVAEIPNMVVSDLILSGICREVGYELYEIDKDLRLYLLYQLQQDARFGKGRMKMLAHFLRKYSHQALHEAEDQDLREIHQQVALATLNPREAAKQIGTSLQAAIVGKEANEQIRLSLLLELLAGQDEAFESLLAFSQKIKAHVQGKLEELSAGPEIASLILSEEKTPDTVLTLPVPERLRDKLKTIRDTKGEAWLEAGRRIARAQLENAAKLDLSGLGLAQIPPPLWQLRSLTQLFLQDNQLTELSPQIDNLRKLTELNLSNNQLKELPDPIGNCQRLQSLILHQNQLSVLPQSLENLIDLKELVLHHNQLSRFPEFVFELISLEKLDVGNNQIEQIPDRYWGLEQPDLSGLSTAELIDVEEVDETHGLKQLYLNHNQIRHIPESIGGLELLEILQLHHNRLTEIPFSFKQLEKLRTNEVRLPWQRGFTIEANPIAAKFEEDWFLRSPQEMIDDLLVTHDPFAVEAEDKPADQQSAEQAAEANPLEEIETIRRLVAEGNLTDALDLGLDYGKSYNVTQVLNEVLEFNQQYSAWKEEFDLATTLNPYQIQTWEEICLNFLHWLNRNEQDVRPESAREQHAPELDSRLIASLQDDIEHNLIREDAEGALNEALNHARQYFNQQIRTEILFQSARWQWQEGLRNQQYIDSSQWERLDQEIRGSVAHLYQSLVSKLQKAALTISFLFVRTISESEDYSKLRDQIGKEAIEFQATMIGSVADLNQHLRSHPNVKGVHFPKSAIQDPKGSLFRFASAQQYTTVFQGLEQLPEFVLFNGSYLAETAQLLLAEGIPFVGALDNTLSEEGALVFAQAFYEGVARGEDYEVAFEKGKKALELADFGTEGNPVLWKRENPKRASSWLAEIERFLNEDNLEEAIKETYLWVRENPELPEEVQTIFLTFHRRYLRAIQYSILGVGSEGDRRAKFENVKSALTEFLNRVQDNPFLESWGRPLLPKTAPPPLINEIETLLAVDAGTSALDRFIEWTGQYAVFAELQDLGILIRWFTLDRESEGQSQIEEFLPALLSEIEEKHFLTEIFNNPLRWPDQWEGYRVQVMKGLDQEVFSELLRQISSSHFAQDGDWQDRFYALSNEYFWLAQKKIENTLADSTYFPIQIKTLTDLFVYLRDIAQFQLIKGAAEDTLEAIREYRLIIANGNVTDALNSFMKDFSSQTDLLPQVQKLFEEYMQLEGSENVNLWGGNPEVSIQHRLRVQQALRLLREAEVALVKQAQPPQAQEQAATEQRPAAATRTTPTFVSLQGEPKLYALLVGINQYADENIRPLQGCIHDVDAVETYIRQNLPTAPGGTNRYGLELMTFRNENATRENVLNGFLSHLAQAGPNDQILFYFAGYGSQESTPEIWRDLEADRLNETLVLYDSRTEGVYDLADKELAFLLSEIGLQDSQITLIFDTSNQGDSTRKVPTEQANIRSWERDRRERSLSTYFIPEEILATKAGPALLPTTRHISLSAASPHQEAQELNLGGRMRGAFTYLLLRTLHQQTGAISYQELSSKLTSSLIEQGTDQQPVLASQAQDQQLDFLLGWTSTKTSTFSIQFVPEEGRWQLNAGLQHGILPPNGGVVVFHQIRVYPVDTPLQSISTVASIGQGQITEVHPTYSWVELEVGIVEQPNAQYPTRIISQPIQRLAYYWDYKGANVSLWQKTIVPQYNHQAYLSLAELSFYRLLHQEDRFTLSSTDPPEVILSEEGQLTKINASMFFRKMVHISKRENILQLRNPGSSIARSDLQIGLFHPQIDQAIEQGPEGFEFQDDSQFRIMVQNQSAESLYAALLYLGDDFEVEPLPFRGTEYIIPIKAGERVWVREEIPFRILTSPRIKSMGKASSLHHFLLIASPEPFDPRVLTLEKIENVLVKPKRAISTWTNTHSLLFDTEVGEFREWNTNQISLTVRAEENIS